ALAAVDSPGFPADSRPAMKAALMALTSGNPAQMAAAAPEINRLAQASHGSFRYADILAALGARDAALTAIEQSAAFRRRPPPSLFQPAMASLRSEPRFLRLLETTGLMK